MAAPPLRQTASDDIRSHIISSLFGKRDDDGTPEETLISFVKVFEEDPVDPAGGAKTRYLMLAVTKLGKVVIHKAKRNNNLTFSKGKTWQLEDVRAVEVIAPMDFALTMTIRRYHWQTDRPKEQHHFLTSVVKVYKTYTKGEVPELINFQLAPANPPASSGPPSSTSTSPMPRYADLGPPPMKAVRSGSSSSVTSAQSSAYPGSEPPARTRPSLDEVRGGSNFGRSPLGESAFPTGQRPSIHDLGLGPTVSSNGQSNGTNGLGRGPPPVQARKTSIDRLGPSDLRKGSAASEYGEPSRPTRRISGEQMRPISETEVVEDTPPRPERRSQGRNATANDNSVFEEDDEVPTRRPSPAGATDDQSPPNSNSQLAPTITTTLPSPAIASSSKMPDPPPSNQKLNRRASFHPPPLNTAFSREVLLTSRTGILPGAGITVDEDGQEEDAILANVEDLLEGFDWTANVGSGEIGGRKKGSADAIEGRLLDELAALDSANIHAFLESDDRIAQVLGHIDEAILELDDIDLQIVGYRMQLQAVSDDISYIESQNRGLQVQTSNQQALLNELRQLLQTVDVPPEDLRILTQESPGSERGVKTLERAAASLYKALQAGMDSANAEVAATIARMKEYQENSAQFSKRISDYLDITFKHQSDSTLSEYRKTSRQTMALAPHNSMGEFLMMYEGLVLYVKEMDETRYQRLCSNYMSTISQLHQSEIKDLLMNFMATLNASAQGDPNEASFAVAAGQAGPKPSALQKSKNMVGIRASDTAKKDRKGDDNSRRISELYQKGLTEIINQVLIEEDFINAFLNLTDTESTFADHMELDSYFRRQAARHATNQMSPGLMQLVRSMMDLVFGFVEGEMRNWVEAAVERNPVAIIGVLGVTERLAKEAEQENTSLFFAQLFDRQLSRQRIALDTFVNEQLRVIDGAKSSTRKRRGATFFVRHFPTFVEKVEAQLDDSDVVLLSRVNDIYEKVVNAIFATLTHIAKLDRGELGAEDKGALGFHVVMIENMYRLVEDVSHLDTPALAVSLERARGLYEENMGSYVRLMLRRAFGRLMDFFDGIERLLQSTPATEISVHSSYSRSNLKKVLKDYTAKDLRKAIEQLSKRVDKHFIDDELASSQDPLVAQLLGVVWRELTSALIKEIRRDEGFIKAVYGDGGLGFEFGTMDVDGICKRVRA